MGVEDQGVVDEMKEGEPDTAKLSWTRWSGSVGMWASCAGRCWGAWWPWGCWSGGSLSKAEEGTTELCFDLLVVEDPDFTA